MDFAFTDVEQRDGILVDQAVIAVNSGEFEAARSLLGPVIERAPEPEAYEKSRAAEEYVLWRYWDPADRAFLEALTEAAEVELPVTYLPSVYPKAYFLLGFMAYQDGDVDAAIAYLQKASEMDPSAPYVYAELGTILSGRKDFDLSNKVYQVATRCRPAHEPAMYARLLRGMGYNQTELGNIEAAQRLYRESLEYDPSSTLAAQELEYLETLARGGSAVDSNMMITGRDGDLSMPGTPGPRMIELIMKVRSLAESGALSPEELASIEGRLLGTTQLRTNADYERCELAVSVIGALHHSVVEGDVPVDQFAEQKPALIEQLCAPPREERKPDA